MPVLHLCLCVAIHLGVISDWPDLSAWSVVFVVDFPVSIPLIAVDQIPPLVTFGLVGTAWWYWISRAVLVGGE
jgi:hypothetical protein